MSLQQETVEKIAMLARIALPAENIAGYTHHLSDILNFVEQLAQADTSNIEPMAHPLDMVATLRPDIVTETDQREHFQQIAPLTENGLYLVPKVIE